jgi:conjugative transfer signal peptidase TraF
MIKFALALISFAIICMLFYALGFRYNATPSIATGIYRIVSGQVKKGDYAWFCPPDVDMVKAAKERGYIFAGSCPGDYVHFMKKVAATESDNVTINASGVYINDRLLEYSKPIAKDGNSRPLSINYLTNYRMGENEYLMMTDCNDKSFDARYFGIVKDSNILKLEQVITWKM